MFGLTPIITFFVFMLAIGILLFIIALNIGFGEHESACVTCGIFGTIFIIISTIVLLATNFPDVNTGVSRQVIVSNEFNVPVRVKYLQYHPYVENEIKIAIIMPDSVKILKNAKVISTTTNYINQIEF